MSEELTNLENVSAGCWTNWSDDILDGTPVTLTGTWKDLGGIQKVEGMDTVVYSINQTINSSNNIQFRLHLEETATGTDNRVLMTKNVQAAVTQFQDKIQEHNVDEDKKYILPPFLLYKLAKWVQLQGRVLTVGATGATVDIVKLKAGIVGK